MPWLILAAEIFCGKFGIIISFFISGVILLCSFLALSICSRTNLQSIFENLSAKLEQSLSIISKYSWFSKFLTNGVLDVACYVSTEQKPRWTFFQMGNLFLTIPKLFVFFVNDVSCFFRLPLYIVRAHSQKVRQIISNPVSAA